MKAWFKTYKPSGWNIHDLRYGGLLIRIQSAIEEINMWLKGELPRLEELEEERLLYNGGEGIPCYNNYYGHTASPGRIAPTA
jgi:hypothetical protein